MPHQEVRDEERPADDYLKEFYLAKAIHATFLAPGNRY